jgi:hypothetical protein
MKFAALSSTLLLLFGATISATSLVGCESGDDGDSGLGGLGGKGASLGGDGSGGKGDPKNTGGLGGAGSGSGGKSGSGSGGKASSSGGQSASGGGSTDETEECNLRYNGCEVPAKVRELAGTYSLTADVVNSCGELGIIVPSGTLTVTGTLTIDETPIVRLELDDLDGTLAISPDDEGFLPRDFSGPSASGRWYAYAREGVENGLGYAEGFNLQLNDDLEFTNVEDGSSSYAVRVYTKRGCSIDFALVE